MLRSRYLWILVLASVCLAGILVWESPETVVSALSKPGYAASPISTIQHFWSFLDNRQIKLVKETTAEALSPEASNEIRLWAGNLQKNPMLSLQKVEFLDTANLHAVSVRVTWKSPPDNVQTFNYVFDIRPAETGWKIYNFARLP